MQAAMMLPRYTPAISAPALCLTDEGQSCIIRYELRHRQQYLQGVNPYSSNRHRVAYDKR